MRHIGFTGTRYGLPPIQLAGLFRVVGEIATEWAGCGGVSAHHGNCPGGDEQFHQLCVDRGFFMVGHLSTHPMFAGCWFNEERAPKPPLVRNRDIVDESERMVAAPAQETEQQRGGTWSTIRYARKSGKPLAIVWPDGRVTYERWPTEQVAGVPSVFGASKEEDE